MKVRGDLEPINAFTVEAQPKKPGFVLVRFFENAVPFEETEEDTVTGGWEYDEYHLELRNTGDIETDVRNNYKALLSQAKEAERNLDPVGTLRAELEEQIAMVDEVAIGLYETQTLQDEALIELYEMIGG